MVCRTRVVLHRIVCVSTRRRRTKPPPANNSSSYFNQQQISCRTRGPAAQIFELPVVHAGGDLRPGQKPRLTPHRARPPLRDERALPARPLGVDMLTHLISARHCPKLPPALIPEISIGHVEVGHMRRVFGRAERGPGGDGLIFENPPVYLAALARDGIGEAWGKRGCLGGGLSGRWLVWEVERRDGGLSGRWNDVKTVMNTCLGGGTRVGDEPNGHSIIAERIQNYTDPKRWNRQSRTRTREEKRRVVPPPRQVSQNCDEYGDLSGR